MNKGDNLVKKLKKRVTVKIEEDNVPVKSMTRRDENFESLKAARSLKLKTTKYCLIEQQLFWKDPGGDFS